MSEYPISDIKVEIIRFILKLNLLYNNHVFTSSRIAQEIIKSKGVKKTFFPKIHRVVREILSEWSKQEICVFLSQTKLGHSRKTKAIYNFTKTGLTKLKTYVISEVAKSITANKRSDESLFLPRKQIISRLSGRVVIV